MNHRCVSCGQEMEVSFGVRNHRTGTFIGSAIPLVCRLCEACARKEVSWWNFGPGSYEAVPDVR